MRFVRTQLGPEHCPDDAAVGGGMPTDRAGADQPGGRLNLLLSYSGWDDSPWVERLPCLLEPMGVRSVRADSADDATKVIKTLPIHVAVVDLGIPLRNLPGVDEGGARVLDLLARLDCPPPTVVIKRRRTARDDRRELAAALRHGAFAVLDRPRDAAGLESMLDVLRRLLGRYYAGRWPGSGPAGASSA